MKNYYDDYEVYRIANAFIMYVDTMNYHNSSSLELIEALNYSVNLANVGEAEEIADYIERMELKEEAETSEEASEWLELLESRLEEAEKENELIVDYIQAQEYKSSW